MKQCITTMMVHHYHVHPRGFRRRYCLRTVKELLNWNWNWKRMMTLPPRTYSTTLQIYTHYSASVRMQNLWLTCTDVWNTMESSYEQHSSKCKKKMMCGCNRACAGLVKTFVYSAMNKTKEKVKGILVYDLQGELGRDLHEKVYPVLSQLWEIHAAKFR